MELLFPGSSTAIPQIPPHTGAAASGDAVMLFHRQGQLGQPCLSPESPAKSLGLGFAPILVFAWSEFGGGQQEPEAPDEPGEAVPPFPPSLLRVKEHSKEFAGIFSLPLCSWEGEGQGRCVCCSPKPQHSCPNGIKAFK